MYKHELIIEILDRIKIVHTDLLDAHQWKHLHPNRQQELLKKYGVFRFAEGQKKIH